MSKQNIFDDAWVSDDARVSGNARVFDDVRVFGDAWVFGNANILGNAEVSGNARVSGNAIIKKTADYLTLGPAKSSGRFTTAHKDSVIGVRVNCGCFSGSLDEFQQAIKETHKEKPEYLRQYLAFVYVIREHFSEELTK